jgi:hypothetical protein
MTGNYTYKRINHFHDLLNQYESKNDNIDDSIIYTVAEQLESTNSRPTHKNIQNVLKNNKYSKYYEQIPTIARKIKNKQIIEIKYINNNNEYECPICLDSDVKILAIFKCNHKICNICSKKILSDDQIKCPLCRAMSLINNNNDEITSEDKNRLLNEYKIICENYDVKFLNHSFVISKLCKVLNININIDPLMNLNKLDYHEQKWNEIANLMNYKKN